LREADRAPLIARTCGAPFVFKKRETDLKGRGALAWGPYEALGYV
jgi:hypothetical protein